MAQRLRWEKIHLEVEPRASSKPGIAQRIFCQTWARVTEGTLAREIREHQRSRTYDTGKRNGRNASLKFVNYLGFFVEQMQGNTVVGRITPIGGLRKGAGFAPAPVVAFPRSIRLVQ